MKNGSLAGQMLTGLSPQGVDLLENYLNRTGDVQTVTFNNMYLFIYYLFTIYLFILGFFLFFYWALRRRAW